MDVEASEAGEAAAAAERVADKERQGKFLIMNRTKVGAQELRPVKRFRIPSRGWMLRLDNAVDLRRAIG